MTRNTLQIGADIGGTFTDIVFQFADGRLEKRKVETTPDDFGRAIVESVTAFLAEKGLGGDSVGEILHATTVATNAILERRGAKTALVTTEGFRDVLELRRIRIPFSYDLSWAKPYLDEAREQIARGESISLEEFNAEVDKRLAKLR